LVEVVSGGSWIDVGEEHPAIGKMDQDKSIAGGGVESGGALRPLGHPHREIAVGREVIGQGNCDVSLVASRRRNCRRSLVMR
jgi:hypothetical protein